ncbi:MAG: UDP-N-acetylmuramoyl-L-alanyl-D-glutamate--2,6-diaminopimelate ligase [Alphaproteobacteria bacterium]|nr:UDP-N-acetylmuramoyl-L-alanyl-D-glutamate--2,6-diaminopimelate ligase [Alphaproteobacteria bacterium]
MKLHDILNEDIPNIEFSGITEKASEVQKGDIFCALKGTKVNGADFIPEAIQNGATAILTDQDIHSEIPVIKVKNPRLILTKIATQLYPSEQLKKVAVTGTNGKTSTVYYVAEIMNQLGTQTASMGTVGVASPSVNIEGSMTTPDAVTLNKTLHLLQDNGLQAVAMEASSHGLDQDRLAGNLLVAGAFTNLTRDHLDYHKTMENYLAAKAKLFSDYIQENGTAVLNADVPEYDFLKKICLERNLKIVSYGKNGETLKLVKQTATLDGQDLTIQVDGKAHEVSLKIYGDFQAYNVLTAVGLCMGLGKSWQEIAPTLNNLTPPAGRLELVGTTQNGAQVFVDYAHTPDALERILLSLRAHTKNKLHCLFGCGGNRDTGKRPQMGEIANRLADYVYITDDNPRNEDPAPIRAAIKEACPKGKEYENRREAILAAIQNLQTGDILVLAGKGHESGQMIQGVNYPFNDKIEAQLILKTMTQKPLWNASELQMALNTAVDKNIYAFGVVFDSRSVQLGDIFVALKTEKNDGHQYVHQALEKGACACIVDHKVEDLLPSNQIIVPDTLKALEALARFARMRTEAMVVGITGSCGKTSTKEMLSACLSKQGKTHATQKNFNNNLGVPFTLSNMPADTQYAVIEMGISHPREMVELSDFVRPNVTLITNIAPAHQEYFPDTRAIAAEKIHILDYQNKEGTIVLNIDDPQYQFLADTATAAGLKKIIRFGQNERADFQLLSAVLNGEKTHVKAMWHGEKLEYNINFVGAHFALNSLGVLATIDAIGASVEQAIQDLQTLLPIQGRGQCYTCTIGQKTVHLIDDAYNANPVSMAASIRALGLRKGNKIAVLGDMLELGEKSQQMHLDMLQYLEQNNINKLYAVGPFMSQVFDLTSPDMQGAKVLSATDLVDILKHDLQDGDWVLFKASHGTRLDLLIQKLKGE